MTSSPYFLPWTTSCGSDDCFVIDEGTLAAPLGEARIIVASGSEERAAQLLTAGARQVLVGEAALLDGSCIARLVASYGAERVGVYVPVSRAEASWSIDAQTNADFTCMVTSMPVPRWDALRANGESTGTDAIWWAEQMILAGASVVVLAADLHTDNLVLGAEAAERLGEHLWLASRSGSPDLVPWVQLAGVTRFVVANPSAQMAAFSGVAA